VPRLTAPDPLAAAGFRQVVEALAGPALTDCGQLALAVSGGPDSLALMWLGAEAFGSRAVVLTVDHGLRAEAAAEAAAVCARARALGLEAHRLDVAVATTGRGLQADARDSRYAALRRWCTGHRVRLLLTAHHAEDQAETLLMRLARGSGLAGLAGIRAVRPLGEDVLLLRPLLGARRAELAAIVARAGWVAADDPSNRDPRHDRTRARALLAKTPWLSPMRLQETAAQLAEAEAALAWAADRAWASRVVHEPPAIRIDAEGLPAELQRRLLGRALETLGAAPRGRAVARLAARLAAGGSGTLDGVAARVSARQWHLAKAPPRRRT
jgi:tRNA(Ile)-lysidine synthase